MLDLSFNIKELYNSWIIYKRRRKTKQTLKKMFSEGYEFRTFNAISKKLPFYGKKELETILYDFGYTPAKRKKDGDELRKK